jgi:Flp pilus assembly secretin CpaC
MTVGVSIASTSRCNMTIITAASAREDLMHIRLSRRRALQLGVAGAATATSLPALAHHGWNWAEDQQSELKGTVKSVSMAPPHPSLKVTAADGKEWLIDLANPNQTERSGFTAASAKAGDAIVVLGNRSKDKSQLWMKAVRITVAGKTYDLYPERIKTN